MIAPGAVGLRRLLARSVRGQREVLHNLTRHHLWAERAVPLSPMTASMSLPDRSRCQDGRYQSTETDKKQR
jgi:hypothetical protein